MAEEGTTAVATAPTVAQRPRCLAVAERGIKTSYDFADFMSGLMSDAVEGRVSPGIVNAACNAGGKLLKVHEMQVKYGTSGGNGRGQKMLMLSLAEDEPHS